VDAVGVIALVVGLWLVSPGGRPAGRDPRIAALGWVLAAVAGLLIITSPLTLPTSSYAPSTGDGSLTSPVLPRAGNPTFPLPPTGAAPS
jgi:hypothetical protein